MRKLPHFDENELSQNPFSYTLSIEVTKRIDNSKLVPDKDGVMLPASTLIERQQSTKIYHVKGIIDTVTALSDRELRLYMYILHSLESGKDYIRINPHHYQKKNNIKDSRTYKTAYTQLIRYNFIAATGFDNVFWINPNLFFSGSRINKYPNNVKITGVWDV